MIAAIDIDDTAWEAIDGLEARTIAAMEAALALAGHGGDVEVSVLYTDDSEVARLNAGWRGKSLPTNVLSFPAPPDQPVPDGEPRPLGDIVLASGVVAREAAEQGKTLAHHALHLVVHGMLHLLGHDHVEDAEAETMEGLERMILAELGIADPYAGERP